MNLFLATVKKEFLLEFREWVRVRTLMAISVLIFVLFSISLGPQSSEYKAMVPGFIWATLVVVSIFAFESSFKHETENDVFLTLRQSPFAKYPFYLGKVLVLQIILFTISLLLAFLVVILFDCQIQSGLS